MIFWRSSKWYSLRAPNASWLSQLESSHVPPSESIENSWFYQSFSCCSCRQSPLFESTISFQSSPTTSKHFYQNTGVNTLKGWYQIKPSPNLVSQPKSPYTAVFTLLRQRALTACKRYIWGEMLVTCHCFQLGTIAQNLIPAVTTSKSKTHAVKRLVVFALKKTQ